ncbi:hypothetical protein, partial [Kocuria marina]|uniref:hypothetical protein n=1 Tax=Kocuria marina TaxID=223184 RepID=UPI0022E3D78F
MPVEAFGQHPLETTAGAARQAHRGGTGLEQGGDDALQQGRHRVVGRGQQPRIHVQLTQLPGPGVGLGRPLHSVRSLCESSVS